jgi:arylsulfatase A-like enzyme
MTRIPHQEGAKTRPSRLPRSLAPLLLAGAIAGSIIGLTACSDGITDEPSALLITLDTTRADMLSCYSGPKGLTPHLEQLAQEGVRYDSAHTTVPVTMPAHASMLTGMYPMRHSVRTNDAQSLPREIDTLAERAQAAGIPTGAIIAAIVLHDRYGLGQGFDEYDQPDFATGPVQGYEQRTATPVIDKAIAWLDARDRSKPFFLWVHLFDPHAPYEAPAEFARRPEARGNPYLGELAFLDHELGRLFDQLRADGTIDQTLVAVVGDHGESLGQHGEMAHGVLCYQATLRVPLILRYPDLHRAGEHSQEMVSVVDLYPTILEALGLPVPGNLDGLSLYRRTIPAERGIYFESFDGYLGFGFSPLAGWMDARGKYLHSSTPQFFDLQNDPREETDLVEGKGALIEEFRRRVDELLERQSYSTSEARTDPEELEALRKLGYTFVGSSFDLPHPFAPSDRPSAAGGMDLHRDTVEGLSLFQAGKPAEAEEILARVIESLPHNPAALLFLGMSRKSQKKYAEAVEAFRILTVERPTMSPAFFNLGLCLLEVDAPEEAVTAFEEAIRNDPGNTACFPPLIRVLRKLGREDEARAYEQR